MNKQQKPVQSAIIASPAEASFLMVSCQVGAEGAVKHELARDWPAFRLAYSRPGFLTFKLPEGHDLFDDFKLGSVFSRSQAFSLGAAKADSLAARASQVLQLVGTRAFDRLHVWPRDLAPPGHRGFEPGLNDESAAARAALLEHLAARSSELAELGELVLDVVLVEPDTWWVGFHRAFDWSSCRPGGLYLGELPAEAVSRAYLKMHESLAWSGLPVVAEDRCVEIGSAPGGAAQVLLERGLYVTGIDPAEMHADVANHPHFVHLRKRGSDVRRREFRKTRWLFADLNVAPSYTLDTVEAIVLHPEVSMRGLLLTLKLLDWKLANETPDYLQRIASWGYRNVRARQLSHHRQEFCVAAADPARR